MNKPAMNKLLILLLSGALTVASPGAAAADNQSEPGLMTKLMVLFSFRMPHVAVPQQVVAPEKDWAIVKGAQAEHAARVASDKQLREAAQRIDERENQLRLAREAFRQEASRVAQEPQPANGDSLELAARRMSQREQEAYRSKLEYARVAREVRDQRQRDATKSYEGL